MRHYALTYFILLAILFTLETLPWAQAFTTGTWTHFLATLSGSLMQLFDESVLVEGSDLRNRVTGYAVSIKAGCNGVEAALILAAAILAYPARWVNRLIGLLSGVFLIQALNVIRIISLYYIGSWSQKALDIAHLYVWPGLIILDALILFLIWIHWQGRAPSSRVTP